MFRALPFLIILMVMLIGSKVLEIFEITSRLNVVGIREIVAQENQAQPAASTNTSEQGGTAAPPSQESEQTTQEVKAEEKEQDKSEPKINFTQTELELLQSLSARKKELDERERSISLKENSLSVIENNISTKVKELQELQAQLNEILKQYEEKEDDKIKSLVKVYENMKPNEAAKIFDQLEMIILLEVAVRMKEAKLAQIIAKMDTYRAKELTVELANRRKVKSN